MPLVYKTVIFDMDGTLLDSAQGVINSVRYALTKLHRPFPDSLDERKLVGPPLRYSFAQLLGIESNLLDAAVEAYREYYGSHGAYEASFYPGMELLLRDLHKAGAAICLATSKYSVMAEKVMDHFGMGSYFRYKAMSDGTEALSTKKAMLAKVLSESRSSAADSVMIGDTVYDAQGAFANDLPFIGVLYGYGTRKEMESEGAGCFAADVPELRTLLLC